MGVKERVLMFIESKEIPIKQFEERCSLSNGYISSMRKGFGVSKLENVLCAFPELDRNWLLYGEGQMLKTETTNSSNYEKELKVNFEGRGVPVYDIDITCGFGSRSLEDEIIVGYIDLPNIRRDGRHVVTATGDSMNPIVKDGDKIVLHELPSWEFLYFGQIYVVVTEDYRMMKYIHKHPTDQTKILLKSENKHFDDMELPKFMIRKLFIVENILTLKTMM